MPLPLPLALTAVVLATVAGGLLGAVTRWWLAWLDRGARVPLSSCVAGTGLLWAALAAWWAGGALPGAAVPLLLGLGWLVVAGSAVDMAVRRLPDALTLPAFPVVLALLVPLGAAAVLRGVVGALLLCGAHAAVRRCVPGAMGGGDVKLAASVGAALAGVSWSAVALGTMLAAFFTAVAGSVLRWVADGKATGSADAGAVAARSAGGGMPAAGSAGSPAAAERAAGAVQSAGTGATAAGEPVGFGGRALPHGPSMLLACLIVVTAAAAWPGPAGVG